MGHISGRSQVYLSKKGSDELFERLKAQILIAPITTWKSNVVSNFAFQNRDLSSLFSFHGCASGQKSMDAGDIELYWQPNSRKKGICLLEIYF